MKKLFCVLSILILSQSAWSASAWQINRYQRIFDSAVAEHSNEFQQCFQKYLEKNPNLEPRTITFKVTVSAEGHVDKIQVVESFYMPVLRCINKRLAGIKMPPTPTKKNITFIKPIRFRKFSY